MILKTNTIYPVSNGNKLKLIVDNNILRYVVYKNSEVVKAGIVREQMNLFYGLGVNLKVLKVEGQTCYI